MKRRMTEREQDALLRGALAGFVTEVESLAAELPVPSPALYAMISEGLERDPTLVPALPPVRRSRAWLVPVPLTALVLAGTVGAASANALPAPAQRVVSDTVATFTPIHLPKPAAKHIPSPASQVPGAVATPTDAPEPGEEGQKPSTVRTPDHGNGQQGTDPQHGRPQGGQRPGQTTARPSSAQPGNGQRGGQSAGESNRQSHDHGDAQDEGHGARRSVPSLLPTLRPSARSHRSPDAHNHGD